MPCGGTARRRPPRRATLAASGCHRLSRTKGSAHVEGHVRSVLMKLDLPEARTPTAGSSRWSPTCAPPARGRAASLHSRATLAGRWQECCSALEAVVFPRLARCPLWTRSRSADAARRSVSLCMESRSAWLGDWTGEPVLHLAQSGSAPFLPPGLAYATSGGSGASVHSDPSATGRRTTCPSPVAVMRAASTPAESGTLRCSAITAATSAVVSS